MLLLCCWWIFILLLHFALLLCVILQTQSIHPSRAFGLRVGHEVQFSTIKMGEFYLSPPCVHCIACINITIYIYASSIIGQPTCTVASFTRGASPPFFHSLLVYLFYVANERSLPHHHQCCCSCYYYIIPNEGRSILWFWAMDTA